MIRSSAMPVVILGAGPAGLGAALKLAERGTFDVTVVEQNSIVGGNAGSFNLAGLSVDYGSHRLHPSCSPEVLADIRRLLGDDLLDRPRHGRIHLRGRWLHFPLKPVNLALHLPPTFALGALGDALAKPFRAAGTDSFAAVLEHGLGRTICRDFYFPYAEKIWGVSPTKLDAEQARRRVSAGSVARLARKVLSAVPGLKPKGGGRFFYPRGGFGQISEAYCQAAIEAGAQVRFKTSVVELEIESGRVEAVHVEGPEGPARLPARHVLSTIPLPVLARSARPTPPAEALAAADSLAYRGMILIYLVLNTEQFTEYDAHYFPAAELSITRLSEPKNYCLAPLPGRTVLCAELPCDPRGPVWSQSNEQLADLVKDDLAGAGLPLRAEVSEIATRRLPQAYPIYTSSYRQHFDRLDQWASAIQGLTSLGRQGLFAHDNTHHTLSMAYAAAQCLLDDGRFDDDRWQTYRRQFEHHVVED